MNSDCVYTNYLSIARGRILSNLNTDINSSSCGSFDRSYWGWKKKDISDTSLQFSLYVLEKLKSHGYEFPDYFYDISYQFLCNNVYSNGSCDQMYPYERHPKAFMDMVPVCQILLDNLNYNCKCKVKVILRKGLRFAKRKEENYGIVCNHLAYDMHQYLVGFSVLNDEEFYEQACKNLNRIKQFTSHEGWNQEYLGSDAGYQTRTLKYLIQSLPYFHDEIKETCRELAYNASVFLAKSILPDGTIFSGFGSRNTSLIYPSGIEYMANHYSDEFGAMANRVRNAFLDERNLHPLTLDYDNFIRLFEDFLEARQHLGNNEKQLTNEFKTIPDFQLPETGLIKKTINGKYQFYLNHKLGGSYAIFKEDELITKESGLLLQLVNRKFIGTKNLQKKSNKICEKKNFLAINVHFAESIHQELNGWKLCLLRILNLSVLRVELFADLFRKFLVGNLVVGRRQSDNGYMKRSFTWNESEIIIQDKIFAKQPISRIYRAKFMHLVHMATSRYYEASEPDYRGFIQEAKVENENLSQVTKRIPLE